MELKEIPPNKTVETPVTIYSQTVNPTTFITNRHYRTTLLHRKARRLIKVTHTERKWEQT